MSILGFFAPTTAAANDTRSVLGNPATVSNVADTDFSGGRAIEHSASARFSLPFPATTLASGEEFNVVGQFGVEAWNPAGSVAVCALDTSTTLGGVAYPIFELRVNQTEGVIIAIRMGAGVETASGVLYTLTLGTPVFFRLRCKRTGAAACEMELYIFESGAWASKGSISRSDWVDAAFRKMDFGVVAYGKGGSGTPRYGRTIIGYQETPTTTCLADSIALADADGATYDGEWTLSTGTDAFALIDDALGSEDTADYIESGTGLTDVEQEVGFAAISPSPTGTILGVNFIVGVPVGSGIPAASLTFAYLTTRLSGVEDERACYYGMTAWVGTGDTGWFFPLDPSAAAWTESSINSATYIMERKSVAANWRIHSALLQVLYEPAAAATRRIFIT